MPASQPSRDLPECGRSADEATSQTYFVDDVELLEDNEKKFRNLDLTYAVRDGIISHCGELDENSIRPRENWFDLKGFDKKGKFQAATWEAIIDYMAGMTDLYDVNQIFFNFLFNITRYSEKH